MRFFKILLILFNFWLVSAVSAQTERSCYTIFDITRGGREPVYSMCRSRTVKGNKVIGNSITKYFGTENIYSEEDYEFEGGIFKTMTQSIPVRSLSLNMWRVGKTLKFKSISNGKVSEKSVDFPDRFMSFYALVDCLKANGDVRAKEPIVVDMCMIDRQTCIEVMVNPLKEKMTFELYPSSMLLRPLMKDYHIRLSDKDLAPIWIHGQSPARRKINGEWENFMAETVRIN